MTGPKDTIKMTIEEYMEAVHRAYDDGYKQAQKDMASKIFTAVRYQEKKAQKNECLYWNE